MTKPLKPKFDACDDVYGTRAALFRLLGSQASPEQASPEVASPPDPANMAALPVRVLEPPVLIPAAPRKALRKARAKTAAAPDLPTLLLQDTFIFRPPEDRSRT